MAKTKDSDTKLPLIKTVFISRRLKKVHQL